MACFSQSSASSSQEPPNLQRPAPDGAGLFCSVGNAAYSSESLSEIRQRRAS